jgi:hypothetical protein
MGLHGYLYPTVLGNTYFYIRISKPLVQSLVLPNIFSSGLNIYLRTIFFFATYGAYPLLIVPVTLFIIRTPQRRAADSDALLPIPDQRNPPCSPTSWAMHWAEEEVGCTLV